MESEVADHCLAFSLSDPQKSCFQGKCNHTHSELCCECNVMGCAVYQQKQRAQNFSL